MKIIAKNKTQADIGQDQAVKTKTADDIIHDIRQRYGINTRRSNIDSLIQHSIGESSNVAKPDYKGELTLRDYATTNLSTRSKDRFTQTTIQVESIASQVELIQESVGTQAQDLLISSKSTNTVLQVNYQETQTTKDVVFLQDLEEIVSFMDDVVSRVNCQKESREIQTIKKECASEFSQTQRDCVDLGVQTWNAIIKSTESQTLSNVSDQGTQNVSPCAESSQQTQISKCDVGTLVEFIDSESNCSQMTKVEEIQEEEFFKQDLILNLLQEKLQEYKFRLKSLE